MDKQAASDRGAARTAVVGGAERPRDPGTRKQDWIASQLRRVYDEALHEEIPEDMLALLGQLDEGEAAEGGEPDGGERS